MFRLIFVATVFAQTLSASAATYDNDLKDKSVELINAISSKAFEKTWKSEKDNWTTAFDDAGDARAMAGQLKTLISQLKEDKAFAASWLSKKDKWLAAAEACSDWEAYADLLIGLGKQINRTVLSDEFDPSSWQSGIEAIKNDYISKVKAPWPQINETTFNNQFMEIFRTSISGLEKMGEGSPVTEEIKGSEVKTWPVKMVLSGAIKADIRWSESHEVSTYRAFYNAGTSRDNAWKILDQLVRFIDARIPEGFISKRKASLDYVDSKMHTYEFDTEEFRITMKRPEVTIGITENEGVYTVVLLIREPYYKNQYKF